MVKDAELHRDEDKKFHELVAARNQADALLHETRKAIKDAGDKVDGAQIAKIETALAELDTAMKGDNKAAIEAKTQALVEASQSLRAAASGQGGPAPGGEAPAQGKAHDDVVDAEFTEVDGDKR